MTMRTFADERKFGTEVLLMTSPMNVFQMVLAKFLALVTVYLVMMASTLLYPIVTAINSKVIIPSLIGVYVGFFLWGIMCIAVGMFISSLTDNSIIAGILGEAVMLALLYITPLFMDKAFYYGIFQHGWNGQTLFFLGVLPWTVLQLLGEEKETRCFNEFGQIFMILTYAAVALSGQLMYRKGFFIVTFVWVSVVIMAGIMRWKNDSSI